MNKANYFFCVRVTNPHVHKSISHALDWVLDKDPQYTDYCYTSEMLHVTLCEVCLENEEDIQRASAALTAMEDDLNVMRPKHQITFRGISTFHEKVMIGNVVCNNDFMRFAEFLTQKLKDAGVNVVEKHATYTPHMTIMKITSMKARKAKVNPINPWLYVHMKEELFGSQDVNSVHLCKMGYDRRPDGFYVTPAEISFS